MRPTLLLSCTVASLVGPLVVLLLWLQGVRSTQLDFDFAEIPQEIGSWTRTGESRFDDTDLRLVRPDEYKLWRYSGPQGSPIFVYIALYRGLGDYGAHSPESCYPSQGWEVSRSRTEVLPVSPDGVLRVRIIEAERAGQKELVLFWFQHAERWPLSAGLEQLVRVYDTIRGQPQYAFIRLSVPILGDADYQHALESLASALAPTVRHVLEKARARPS